MTLVVRRILVTAAVAALVALAAIGAARVTATPGPGPAGPVTPAALGVAPVPGVSGDAGGDAGLATDLDAILAANATATAPTGAVAARGELRRLAAWRRLVHATVVVDLRQGGLTTVQLDHGTISAVTATSLTIKEADGGSVTVRLGDETRVRRDGSRAAIADLKTADEVFAMSKVEAAGPTSYLVVVPRG